MILLRGGDFIDPESQTTLMASVIAKNAAKGKLTTLGVPGARHAYAYLPDMTRAAAGLAGVRADLPAYADIPFAGHTFSIDDLAGIVTELTGKPVRIGRFPWWFMRGAAPFWELARELPEMRYLFEVPHEMDPAPLRRWLPDFRDTPLRAVIAAQIGLQDVLRAA